MVYLSQLKKSKRSKVLVAALLPLLCLPTLAMARFFPYVGVDAGGSQGQWPLRDDTGTRTSFSAPGPVGGVVAGFGAFFGNSFWIAGEASGYYTGEHTSTKQINTVAGAASTNTNLRYNYSVSVLPGFRFGSRMMAYARFGVVRGRFKTWEELLSTGETAVEQVWSTGYEGGIGVEGILGNNWSARGEIDRIYYNTFTALDNRISPIDNQYRLGLIYTFV